MASLNSDLSGRKCSKCGSRNLTLALEREDEVIIQCEDCGNWDY